MTASTCLRCDWRGRSGPRTCPRCGAAAVFAVAPPRRRPVDALPPGAPPPEARADTPGPPDRLPPADPAVAEARAPRERSSLPLVAAAVVALVVLPNALPSGDAVPPAPTPAAPAPDAVPTALGFLEAYAAFDGDRAIGFLAHDAQISLLIRSIGADGVRGTTRELRSYLELLEAWRYEHEVTSCDAVGTSDAGTDVRCRFDYDFLGSDRLGLGPYTGSSFDLTVRDGEIVRVSKVWAFDRFAREMWLPFAEWISREHPRDATKMYTDHTHRGVRLDAASIRRWARHTEGYVRLQLTDRG